MDKQAVHADLERARETFRQLIADASAEELRRPSNGTRWSNKQLLFHMLLGFLIVPLLTLVRLFSRLPVSVSRTYARALSTRRPSRSTS